jgi:hypothetical protein
MEPFVTLKPAMLENQIDLCGGATGWYFGESQGAVIVGCRALE